jgi:hypothetical protein
MVDKLQLLKEPTEEVTKAVTKFMDKRLGIEIDKEEILDLYEVIIKSGACEGEER